MADKVKLIPRQIREAELSTARFLSAEEQKVYEKACQKYSEKARGSLENKESNLWKILLLNDIGIRTATLPELECALENGLSLRGHYEDAREVILRSKGDSYQPNDYVAKHLAKKLKIRGQIRNPLIITNLKPVEDENSEYGLIAEPTGKTEIIEARDFNHENNQRKFKRINPSYSIEFDEKGDRTLYTRQQGLSRLCLGRDLGLFSDGEGLAGSSAVGRVVVVSGEATSQKINEYVNQLTKEKAKRDSQLTKRFDKAKQVLDTAYKQAEAILKRK